MKKRIIGILLLAVMLTLSLVSCGTSYSDYNYSDYATFDKEAFEADLLKLVIEDGDFSRDEDTRKEKIADAIVKALANKANTDDKIKTGAVSAPDKLYYCYYATVTIDGVEKVLAVNMKEASPSNLQFGLSSTVDLQAAIEEAFEGVDIKNSIYATTTSGKFVADTQKSKDAYISYKVEYEKDGKTVTDTTLLLRLTSLPRTTLLRSSLKRPRLSVLLLIPLSLPRTA